MSASSRIRHRDPPLVRRGLRPHHRSPVSALRPTGQDLKALPSPEFGTVPLQSHPIASSFCRLAVGLIISRSWVQNPSPATRISRLRLDCRAFSLNRTLLVHFRSLPRFISRGPLPPLPGGSKFLGFKTVSKILTWRGSTERDPSGLNRTLGSRPRRHHSSQKSGAALLDCRRSEGHGRVVSGRCD